MPVLKGGMTFILFFELALSTWANKFINIVHHSITQGGYLVLVTAAELRVMTKQDPESVYHDCSAINIVVVPRGGKIELAPAKQISSSFLFSLSKYGTTQTRSHLVWKGFLVFRKLHCNGTIRKSTQIIVIIIFERTEYFYQLFTPDPNCISLWLDIHATA